MAADLSLLKPKVKQLAEKFLSECKKKKYTVIITRTYRTTAEQNALYAQGRTKPGKIVTNARGGYSFHNYGVAFDFAPMVNGKIDWSDIALFTAIGEIGERMGLEWGGRWKTFRDYPHLQYCAGYAIKDFIDNKIDWHKFA